MTYRRIGRPTARVERDYSPKVEWRLPTANQVAENAAITDVPAPRWPEVPILEACPDYSRDTPSSSQKWKKPANKADWRTPASYSAFKKSSRLTPDRRRIL